MNFRMTLYTTSTLLLFALAGCEDIAGTGDGESSSTIQSSSSQEELPSSSEQDPSSSSEIGRSSSSLPDAVCSVPEQNLVNQVIPQTKSTGMATTTSIYDTSYSAWQAFDGASTWTQWISGRIFPSTTQTANLAYTFAVPTKIVAYSLRGRYDTLKDRLPKKWKLQGTSKSSASVNDPVDASAWNTLDEQSEIVIGDQWVSTGTSATLSFEICTPGNYSQYRLIFEEVNGSAVVDLIEVELLAPQIISECLDLENSSLTDVVPVMTAEENVSVSSNSIYSESYPAWLGFDNAPKWTQFISGHNFRPFTEAVELSVDLKQPVEIVAYSIKGRFDTLNDRLPKAWTLQGSNDGNSWDTLDTQMGRNLDFWYSSETTTQAQFDLCQSASFQNYRLVFTEVNGSSVVDLIEIQLLGKEIEQ